jgi:hypothetical protein
MSKSIRLVEQIIGTQHVITSPDVPGLYVAHADLETARREVKPTLDMMSRMDARRRKRNTVLNKATA